MRVTLLLPTPEEIQPFDPTAALPGDLERLVKMRWLPPLEASAKKQKALLFPKIEIKKSDEEKRRVANNPRGTFLVTLKDEYLQRKREEQEEQARRAMASKDQDWGILKTLASETRFANYINSLLSRKKSSTVEEVAQVEIEEQEEESEQEEEVYIPVKVPHNPKADSLTQIFEYVENSAFKRPPFDMRNIANHDTYAYGRPPSYPNFEELSRAFKELDAMGEFVGKAWFQIQKDDQIFSIHTTEFSKTTTEEEVQRTKTPIRQQRSRPYKKEKTVKEYVDDFKSLEENLSSKLADTLARRKEDRYECCEKPEYRRKVIGMANRDTKNKRRKNPAWQLPYLWAQFEEHKLHILAPNGTMAEPLMSLPSGFMNRRKGQLLNAALVDFTKKEKQDKVSLLI
ncbi:hypothetical protein EDD86DRAFT_273120 [Gorgonomyces haynaldii]|nr:hypothetical protein EDD86DRAFT_273120 [Gorgonomyces haynaldii]